MARASRPRSSPSGPLASGPLRGAGTALVLSLAAVAACEAAQSYIYTARRYDEAGACLEPYAPVEVVEGSGAAATCPETCLVVDDDVFVTTMCPPVPAIATELQPDAEACIAARHAAGTTCGEEEARSDASAGAEDSGGGGSGDASGPGSGLDAGTD